MKNNSVQHYNDYAETLYSDKTRGYDELKFHRAYLRTNFSDILPEKKDAKILEIGVGSGQTMKALQSMGYGNVSGVDIAQRLVQRAQDHDLECMYTDDTNAFLGEREGAYDAIFLFHVIEHITRCEMADFLGAINGALKNGGVLIIATPSVQNIFYVGPFYDFTHVNFFTERSLAQACTSGGFTNIIVRGEKTPINIYGEGSLNKIKYFARNMLGHVGRAVVAVVLRTIRLSMGTLNPKHLSENLVSLCRK